MYRKGVTLVELLIVLIIVAILSVVIFVSMTGNLDDARRAGLRDRRDRLNSAVQSWAAAGLAKQFRADEYYDGNHDYVWYTSLTEGITAIKTAHNDDTVAGDNIGVGVNLLLASWYKAGGNQFLTSNITDNDETDFNLWYNSGKDSWMVTSTELQATGGD